MLNVLFPRRKWRLLRVWHGIFWCLTIALILPAPARAQAQPASKPASSPKSATAGAPAAGSTKSSGDAEKPKMGADGPAVAPDAGDSDDEDADPIRTQKIVANEIFRDPKAERLLDITKFPHVNNGRPVPQADLLELNAMAGGVNANIDRSLIDRVVDAMVSKLTDHANIQALIDPPQRPTPSKGVEEATKALLEPIFLARANKNQDFLTTYNRILLQKLTPLLKNHLVPRVQAMIVLGQSGSQEFLPLYELQIRDPNQTVWVKLWALQGMANIIAGGAHLTGQNQVDAARLVSDFVDKEEELPWPAQVRAMEVLTAMRQGFEPNKPRQAMMASSAMRLLTDGQAKPEVRAEAAKALGFMQITPTVPKYNYDLVAHSIGLLAAELGTKIATLVPSPPVRAVAAKGAGRSAAARGAAAAKAAAKPAGPNAPAAPVVPTNPAKARYFTALLIGPVYQALDGETIARESGLCHATANPTPAYSAKVFEMVKAVAKASVDLIYSVSREVDDKKKNLGAQVNDLREFLEQNAPADRHLVAGGVEFPLPQAEPAPLPAPGAQTAAPAAN